MEKNTYLGNNNIQNNNFTEENLMQNEDVVNKQGDMILEHEDQQVFNEVSDTEFISNNIQKCDTRQIQQIEQNFKVCNLSTNEKDRISTPEKPARQQIQTEQNNDFLTNNTVLNQKNYPQFQNIQSQISEIPQEPQKQQQQEQQQQGQQGQQQVRKIPLIGKTSSEPVKVFPKLFEQESDQKNIFIAGDKYPVQYTKMVHENSNGDFQINQNLNQNQNINNAQSNAQKEMEIQEKLDQNLQIFNKNIEDYQTYNQQQQQQKHTSVFQNCQTSPQSVKNMKKLFLIMFVQKNVPKSMQKISQQRKFSSKKHSSDGCSSQKSPTNKYNSEQIQEIKMGEFNAGTVKEILNDFMQLRNRKSSVCDNLSLHSLVDVNSMDNNYNNEDCSSNNEYEPAPFKRVKPKGKLVKVKDVKIQNVNNYSDLKATANIDLQTSIAYQYIDHQYQHPYKNGDSFQIFHLSFYDYDKYMNQLEKSIYQNGRFEKNYMIINFAKSTDYEEDFSQVGLDTSIQLIKALKFIDNEVYAIKRIKLQDEVTLESLEEDQIFQQMRYMAKFNHPNVVRINGWWIENQFNSESEEQEYFLYIEMEYISYEVTSNSLLEYIFNYLNEDNMTKGEIKKQAYEIVSQVLEGLDYLHKQGFFHCDLKPENILIAQDYNNNIVAKLADFDESIKISENKPLVIPIGTFGYVQKSVGDVYEYRDDLYSLGHVLFDLLYYDDQKRIKLHNQLAKGQIPEQFQEMFPKEYVLIEMLVVRKTIKSIDGLRGSNAYQQWKEECLKGSFSIDQKSNKGIQDEMELSI